MTSEHLSLLANHLWQSTIFTMAAALLAFALRKNRAQSRYWLWLAASIKFVIPFSLLVTAGSLVEWRGVSPVSAPVAVAIDQVSQPFTTSAVLASVPSSLPAPSRILPSVLLALWICGSGVVLWGWWKRWRSIRVAVRAAAPLNFEAPIPVMSSPMLLEPGVFGVFRPVLLLPRGIADRLTTAQLAAILAHELCHVRRRDNLAAAFHMTIQTIFWFHPLIWWIGARLVDERERACDEEVVQLGNEPEVYASGILSVCKYYVESPLLCASGVTGSDLKKRIEAIMTSRISYRLTFTRKLLLAIAGIAAIAGPIIFGIVNASQGRAQSTESDKAELKFEVASIKPSDPEARNSGVNILPGGGLKLTNIPLKMMVTFAYNVQRFQVIGGPDWIEKERYDIVAKPERPEGPSDLKKATDSDFKALEEQLRERLRSLLAERFQLAVHRETKEGSIYALMTAKSGPKLTESDDQSAGPRHMRNGRGQMIAQRTSLQMLANTLSMNLGRPVIDRTGLTKNYDFELKWTPEPGEGRMAGPGGPPPPGERPEGASAPDLSGPSIFTAVQEQLGLKLESTKGPIPMIVIDKAEKPSAN